MSGSFTKSAVEDVNPNLGTTLRDALLHRLASRTPQVKNTERIVGMGT
jgi:hypothetical protein